MACGNVSGATFSFVVVGCSGDDTSDSSSSSSSSGGGGETKEKAILLTANTWANGNITTSGGEQWFKCTVTAPSQFYVHFQPGTMSKADVELYYSNDVMRGGYYFDNINKRYLFGAVTENDEYYIKVKPYNSPSGTYKIAFSNYATAPSP